MTIKQKTITVDIEGGRQIVVRRMRWKDAREFFKKLAALVATIYGAKPASAAGDSPAAAPTPAQSFVSGLFANLTDIISNSEELVAHLCTKSTDLSPENLDDLDQAAALGVLQAALETNYDDEVKNSLAGIGAKIAMLLPAKTKTT